MFHCRRLLSQVHIPHIHQHHFSRPHRRLLNSPTVRAIAIRSHVQVPKATYRRDGVRENTSQAPRISWFTTSLCLAGRNMGTGNRAIDAETYTSLRRENRNLVANLPTDSYLYVLKQASEHKSRELFNWVALDLLEVYKGQDSERNAILRTLISKNSTALESGTVLSILRHFQQTLGGLDFLSEALVEQLANLARDIPPSSTAMRPLLELLQPVLLARIRRYHVPTGVRSITYRPPRIVYASFGFLHKLIIESHQPEALSIFQVLVDSGLVPTEVMQGLDGSSNDFKLIICSALVKASLHWNWRGLAVTLMTDLLKSPHKPDQSIIDLNTDAIYALLDTPSHIDIRACGQLIRRVHRHAPISDSLTRHFYKCAADLSLGAEIEALYNFTRSLAVLEVTRYPPPQGVALYLLMSHLTSKSRRTHLSRELASEVVEDNLHIPLAFRARFISMTAAQGYGKLSRALWERYSIGKDKHVVVGNSGLMIRIISLFSRLRRNAKIQVSARGTAFTPLQPTSDKDAHSHLKPMEGFDTGGAIGPVNRDVYTPSTLSTNGEQGHLDLSAFLERVLREYREHHAPLTNAHHRVVTSYARACFILGNFTDGFNTFKVLLNRKEVPDLYDVNVALSAVAEVNPHLGARMIERMESQGLTPDAVSFCTVMHHALAHKDMPLVKEMMEQVRRLPVSQLSLKSVAGLIRATVADEGDDSRAVQRSKLQAALTLVKSLAETNITASPQTGKYLVSTSLRAGDPVMAYKFWKLFLKDGAVWDDNEQRFQRHLIAYWLKRHQYRLGKSQMTDMLSQLGE